MLIVLKSITCIKGIDPSKLKAFNPRHINGGCQLFRKNGNYFDLWNLYRLLKTTPRARSWTSFGRSALSLFIPIFKKRYDPDIQRISWIAHVNQVPSFDDDEVFTGSEESGEEW